MGLEYRIKVLGSAVIIGFMAAFYWAPYVINQISKPAEPTNRIILKKETFGDDPLGLKTVLGN